MTVATCQKTPFFLIAVRALSVSKGGNPFMDSLRQFAFVGHRLSEQLSSRSNDRSVR